MIRPFEVSTSTVPFTPSSSIRPELVLTLTEPTFIRWTAPLDTSPPTGTPAGTSTV
jgi:hypothetical protein